MQRDCLANTSEICGGKMEQQLIEKYPLLFGDTSELSFPKGWYPLLDTMCSQLMEKYESELNYYEYANIHKEDPEVNPYTKDEHSKTYSDEEIEKRRVSTDVERQLLCKIDVIKEKFGKLRIYADIKKAEDDTVIEFCETLSGVVCEECGATVGVKTYPIGWFRTLCEKHACEHYGEKLISENNDEVI